MNFKDQMQEMKWEGLEDAPCIRCGKRWVLQQFVMTLTKLTDFSWLCDLTGVWMLIRRKCISERSMRGEGKPQ